MAVPQETPLSESQWLGGSKGPHSRATSKDLPEYQSAVPPGAAGSKEAKFPYQHSADSSPTSLPFRGHSVQASQTSLNLDSPPTPPLKDEAPNPETPKSNRTSMAVNDGDVGSVYFRPRNLSRTGSVTSLSRVSFSSQISQLTSTKLPDASSLSGSIAAIPNSSKATRALSDAGDQIQSWMHKASEVLGGLDAGDDAEWAAAAGRDGLGEVDGAIHRFESLIQVYVEAVEGLQLRRDASAIPQSEMKRVVQQVEKVVKDWQAIKDSLNGVKKQVELAMEWEELRDAVIEEIGAEVESLTRLVFEMEEERHRATSSDQQPEINANLDISELETIVEEAPNAPTIKKLAAPKHQDNGQIVPPLSPLSPSSPAMAREDSNMLGLFARMQPLRASLDFLPMKLANFRTRAHNTLPSACADLDNRRRSLEQQWHRLESDAESLRKELGEDRWLLVFRNAGKQALRLIDSVGRTVTKLDEALDSNTHLSHATGTMKKIENFEAKKRHYSPAIERIMHTIERGVKDRLTVNGEILRLQTEIHSRWRATLADVKNMESTLTAYDGATTQQLRDSVSSILSSEKSLLSSTAESAGSSSASSVGTPSKRTSQVEPVAPYAGSKPRQTSTNSLSGPATPANKRYSSLPTPSPASARVPRRTPLSKTGVNEPSPRSVTALHQRQTPVTPATNVSSPSSRFSKPSSTSSTPSSRPRWNASAKASTDVGHHFKPLSSSEPSPYRKNLPARRPPSRHTPPSTSSPLSRRPSAQPSLSPPSAPNSAARTGRRPSSLYLSTSATSPSLQAPPSATTTASTAIESPTDTAAAMSRPGSSMTSYSARRTSLLPQPRSRASSANMRQNSGGLGIGASPSSAATNRHSRFPSGNSNASGAGTTGRPEWRG